MSSSLRILYAAGPGNVLGTYRHWKESRDDPSQVSVTYSGQFYDLCREFGDEAYVISNARRSKSAPSGRVIREGSFLFENRPVLFENRAGALYHLGQIWSALRLVASAIRYRANVAVIACGTAHWFPLAILPLLGVKVVSSMHCTLWKKNHRLSGVPRIIWKLNRFFFNQSVSTILSASHDITEQLDELTAGQHRPISEFLPTYRRGSFDGNSVPDESHYPFRVCFAGRIERNKGVFGLLEIARRFAAEGRSDIEFDICGNGSALEELRAAVEQCGLSARFRCHGHCAKPTMRQMYGRCHAVIVPTTTEFFEGFNQVVAEGVLAGRPVITSAVCPALQYVRQGVVEVPPDDTRAYGDAILRLADDLSFYASRIEGCQAAQEQFYDLERGWEAALRRALVPMRVQRDSHRRQSLRVKCRKRGRLDSPPADSLITRVSF
jgi:glycosyltransferase involved in cell wall biosynthesis